MSSEAPPTYYDKGSVELVVETPVMMKKLEKPKNATSSACIDLFRWLYNEAATDGDIASSLSQRWLLFGDSTLFHAYNNVLRKYFQSVLVHPKYCQYRALPNEKPVCGLHRLLNYTPATQWVPPTRTEGPLLTGKEKPFCMDCSSCRSQYAECHYDIRHPANTTTNRTQIQQRHRPPVVGGFFGVEFARDVESPSTHYPTTQETIFHFIHSAWNHPTAQRQVYGDQPVCVALVGHHDAAIPGITNADYRANLYWYFHLLEQHCHFVVWITNNAPETDQMAQKRKRTALWNQFAKEYWLHPNRKSLNGHGSTADGAAAMVMDVFEASIGPPHNDNIHMTVDWYKALGATLLEMIRNVGVV